MLPAGWLASLRPRLLRGLLIWLLLVSVLAGVHLAFGAQLRQRPARVDWPARTLAMEAQRSWSQWSSCPLDTVAGDYWLAGLIATDQKLGPSVLIDGDPRFSPWATPERLRAKGALWVGLPQAGAATMPAALEAAAQSGDLQLHSGEWQIPWPYRPHGAPLTVQWRILSPAHCATALP